MPYTILLIVDFHLMPAFDIQARFALLASDLYAYISNYRNTLFLSHILLHLSAMPIPLFCSFHPSPALFDSVAPVLTFHPDLSLPAAHSALYNKISHN